MGVSEIASFQQKQHPKDNQATYFGPEPIPPQTIKQYCIFGALRKPNDNEHPKNNQANNQATKRAP